MTDILNGTKRGVARKLQKGEVLPDNARLLTDEEMYNIQIDRINRHKPQTEMWYYTYGAYVGTTLAALSGWMIEKEIRANLRLGTLSFFTTKACVIVVPALMSYTTHELVVKRNILLGKEGCAICSMTQSGVVQTFSSVFYTYLASMLVCQPIAYKYRLQKFPELTVKPWERPSHYLNFIRKISPPTQLMLILTMANFTAGGLLARKDLQLFYRYLAQPPSAHEVQQEFENGTPV